MEEGGTDLDECPRWPRGALPSGWVPAACVVCFAQPICSAGEARLAEWDRRIKRADRRLTPTAVVCEKHFDESFIERAFAITVNGVVNKIPHDKPRLKPDAAGHASIEGTPAGHREKEPLKAFALQIPPTSCIAALLGFTKNKSACGCFTEKKILRFKHQNGQRLPCRCCGNTAGYEERAAPRHPPALQRSKRQPPAFIQSVHGVLCEKEIPSVPVKTKTGVIEAAAHVTTLP
ncbi:hypothetical protein HPB50_014615 [Hyalomma asiaticum]|uniref:Uncharacterized protein n=1 Tax=Hyalomma asiaticum TaxID=266040 RepID=A0ACB7TKS8_HYAAI|nr:hypothetical protein HPB50_014615 [Hyalomma asiaticum]